MFLQIQPTIIQGYFIIFIPESLIDLSSSRQIGNIEYVKANVRYEYKGNEH